MASGSATKIEERMRISEFYANKSILITGATGFIGKVLLWKLLQSCSLVNTIFVLLRSKHGKDISTRKRDLLNSPIFDNFKQTKAKLLDKIVIIPGDVGEPNLGLSDQNRARLVDEVSIVFHGAAMLNMEASLKNAINVNTESIIRMMDLAQKMKNLSAFVYVSTAYCCCNENVVEEKLYPMEINPRSIINMVHTLPSAILNKITTELISPLPNTYTYTKRLAEILIAEYNTKIPSLAIARPTIGYREPIRGWVDNKDGIIGLCLAGATGVIQTCYILPDVKTNLVPVDNVCNGLIAIPWMEVQKKSSQISVYNLAETKENTITYGKFLEIGYATTMKYPFELMLWYPSKTMAEPNKTLFQIKAIFYHWIPAYIIDFILFALGKKQIMKHIHRKISRGVQVFSYFVSQEWEFQTNNLASLKNSMNPLDVDIFPFNIPNIHVTDEIMKNTMLVMKKYMMKEKSDNSQTCRRNLRILYILKMTVYAIFCFILIKVVLNWAKSQLDKSSAALIL